jgi:hypothetical protein
MILRWIRQDTQARKKSIGSADPSAGSARVQNASRAGGSKSGRPLAQSHFDSSLLSQSPYAIAHPSASRRKPVDPYDQIVDEVGESEFNAILEEVCDTVMPRKPAKRRVLQHSAKVKSDHQSSADIPWATLFHKMGEETAISLTEALAMLQDIALLHPNVAPAIANVADLLDHARRVALIAQQFSQLRGGAQQQAELLSLRQMVSDAITQRARWLHRRRVKARLGLLDAQLSVSPVALASLLDELINWAGGLAQDIGFAVREPSSNQPHAQLLVIARVSTASIAPDQWQNVGWYLWHQLARSMGAKAELQVTQDALSVTVNFVPTPPETEPQQHAKDYAHTVQDTDMRSVIAGCRVLLLLGSQQIHDQAHQAVSSLGLQIHSCANIAQAKVVLGMHQASDAHADPSNWPQAIVFDGNLDLLDITLLREQIRAHKPHSKMAYVEISELVGSDFHVSQMGDASTAHVAAKAIHQSLAPALVFELCKVI